MRLLPVMLVVVMTLTQLGAASGDLLPGDGYTPTQARQMVASGDGRIVPTLMKWLDRGFNAGTAPSGDERLWIAIDGIGAFGVDEAGPTLVSLYRRPATKTSTKSSIAIAAARMPSKRSAKFLKELVNDPQLSDRARYSAAAGLVQLGDETARVVLIKGYKQYLVDISTKHSWNQDVRDILEKLYDVPIMAQIEQLTPDQTDQRAKNNITTLLERMEINSLSVDELFKLAENTNWQQGSYKRYPAIEELGEKGTPEVIDRIKAIAPWASVDSGAVQIQQKFLEDYKTKAIARIRQRSYNAEKTKR